MAAENSQLFFLLPYFLSLCRLQIAPSSGTDCNLPHLFKSWCFCRICILLTSVTSKVLLRDSLVSGNFLYELVKKQDNTPDLLSKINDFIFFLFNLRTKLMMN